MRDAFEAGRRQVIIDLAARFAAAIRRGDAETIDACETLFQRDRRLRGS